MADQKQQYVYSFGLEKSPKPPLDTNLLGGKGRNLAEMTSIGITVPPGIIISTDACRAYQKNHRSFPEGLKEQVFEYMHMLEDQMRIKFDDTDNPLLISVRSGAPVSMPGMMDTVLNVGLNDESVIGFAKTNNNEKLAYDSYRRLIMMYANVVRGLDKNYFEEIFDKIKEKEGVEHDFEVSTEGFKECCKLSKEAYKIHLDDDFPQDPWQQLITGIAAVFNSWDGNRAKVYRQVNGIADDMGTAVNIQTMVFGNKNNNSATGVAFTRDPATGDDHFYGEFLSNAQGEEVVAGIRTPHPINTYQKDITASTLNSLEEIMPEAYKQLYDIQNKLEHHYKDMQDMEFTIDDGRLFMLQTRTGKRTGFASIRIAIDMLEEGLIDEKTALMRIDANQITQLLAPIFDTSEKKAVYGKMVAKGLNAGPGAASGKAVFTTEKSVEWEKKGIDSILVRKETNPDDFPGMVAARGILTARGGSTSHAAVVARGMGKPCVAGCGALIINEKEGTLTANGITIKEGDPISIDGTTGEVFFCSLDTHPSEVVQAFIKKTIDPEKSKICKEYMTIMTLADKYRKIGIYTNADTPEDSYVARAFGAEGTGLCRTEHMFMAPDRLADVRKMFFSTSTEARKNAIAKLLPHQKKDFLGIFRAMDGLPVTIRLLDPPLHEFMPHSDEELSSLAKSMNMDIKELTEIRNSLHESNPMLGHRGCRLGIVYPNITRMQARAIIEAAIEVSQEGKTVMAEIMVPLVATKKEFEHQKAIITTTAEEVFKEKGSTIEYKIGTMIELPRAAIAAGRIAEEAEFFSFGTNDLTQTTFGISRDDCGKFVPTYIEGVPNPKNEKETMRIMENDPFQTIDQEGVGELMRIAIAKGRETRKDMKCGICGEHGGEPKSVIFCHNIGLNYVSCSPYRVPVARVAAAQAVLLSE